ncbi:MAG: HAMP domain-containing protein [Silvanigrellales bacterium]|nr:HAMP domain-containing protein [Silvanigrellales bacterium]
MNVKARFAATVFWVITVLLLLSLGAYIEIDVVRLAENLRENTAFVPMALFFATVNLNVLLLFVLVFLVFRNGVKLVVDRRRQVLGSSLRTKLVTSFLFFSLLPTVILLYISTKFVNANFEKWLPRDLVETTRESLSTETRYREKLGRLLVAAGRNAGSTLLASPENIVPAGVDFLYNSAQKKFMAGSDEAREASALLERIAEEHAARVGASPTWILGEDQRLVALVRVGEVSSKDVRLLGVIAPPSVHPQWQSLSTEFSSAQPGVELVRLSYYVMLGVLTLLVVFSATWLGFTLARELTIPIQVLAQATEAVAQGNYRVTIDDIVSDDELGSLARSFRSMVTDLNAAKEQADASALELRQKADEIFEKSEYNAILLRDINAAVITCDRDGRVENWNQESSWLFDVKEENARGRLLSELIDSRFFKHALLPLFDRVGLTKDHRAAGDYAGKLGSVDAQLQITVSLVASPSGQADTVIFINDITELARAQRIAAWRDVARRIAHEIKNPLTPIKLGAQRLSRRFEDRFEQPEDAEVFRECVKVILHSTESIKGLVDEFIRFARMPQAVLREGDVREPVRMAVAGFADNPDHVLVSLQCEENVPLRARFDTDQMVRLCANLLSNAIAASAQAGAPEVRVTLRRNLLTRQVQLEVADWGTGIPSDLKAKIFEPYFSTKRTGMGLGLVIVQQIVNDHEGQMSIEDNVPSGTLFVVEIPLAGSGGVNPGTSEVNDTRSLTRA